MISKAQRVTLLVVLVTINFIYYISAAYIICSNDGSHFALVSALVEKGSVEIREYIEYTRMYDFAYKDGGYYSDRPPGTAFLAAPFYLFGKLVGETGLGKHLSRHENIKEVFVIFLPNIAGTLTVFLMFKLFTHFKLGFATSLLAAIIFAFCTPAWFESTRLFSHSISMATVLAAVALLLTTERFDYASRRRIIGISALLALASIVEIQNILFVGVFGLYVVVSGKIDRKGIADRKLRASLVGAVVVFAAIYSALLVYNYAAFNEITIKSNKYNPIFTGERSFFTSLSGNFLVGVDTLFTNFLHPELLFDWTKGVRNDALGLFVVSPVLLLSVAGFCYFFRSHARDAVLFLVLILVEVGIGASHRYVHTRHIFTILPYIFFPVALVVDRSLKRMKDARANALKRYSPVLLVLVLSLLSLAREFYFMNTYWGRSLSTPFMFIREIPSYIVFYGPLAVVFFLIRRLRSAGGGEASVK